jgi:caffeoyl-CoA O-methyltransferase
MAQSSLGLPADLRAYLLKVGVREPDLLRRLRDETESLPQHNMQISAEQGALMSMLVEVSGARRCIELGTFTGYSSLAVALALPDDGSIVCCDVSEEWTSMARRYWAEAGVEKKVDLRIGPALDTLDALLADGESGTYDFAFVDADKVSYPRYYRRLLELVRPGGLILWDNVLWGGDVIRPEVVDDDTRAIRSLNDQLVADERVSIVMVPISDGLTILRKR